MRGPSFLLLIGLLLAPVSVPAAELTGAATPIGSAFCRAGEAGKPARCPGPSGVDAYLAEGEGGPLVSLGSPEAGFVGIGRGAVLGSTMEWRLADGMPFAGIVRYRLPADSDGSVRDVLAVLKVSEASRPGCLVALVDLTVNPDGRAMARQLADDRAPGFSCGADVARFNGIRSDWAQGLEILQAP